MNEDRPIRKKYDGWTLLDRAYESIEGDVFDDIYFHLYECNSLLF